MRFNCENLDVYKLSRRLILEVYKLTGKFPSSENFGLVSQINRGVVSICLNIAEGSAKASKKDFANFIRISIGSLIELDSSLKISIDLRYINQKSYDNIDPLIQELFFKLIGLHKKLKQ